MLFRLWTTSANALNLSGPNNIVEHVRRDSVPAALSCHQMAEIVWSLSGGPDAFVAYELTTESVNGYQSERLAL